MKITSSTFINIVLATILVTSTFFVTVTSNAGEYDPWLDYNEDGYINIKEAVMLGVAFGTQGDPTKNITIVGHATQLLRPAVHVSIPAYDFWASGYIWIDGYAKVTVLIFVSEPTGFTLYVYASNYGGYSWLVESASDFGCSWVKTYDAMNQRILIEVLNAGAETAYVNVDVYLVA